MKINGTYTFDAPQDVVWESLLDPVVLAAVMPGCEKLDKTDDGTYEGVLKIKVGPVQGSFKGKVQLDNIDAPSGYTMNVDGRGAPGFVKATSSVSLEGKGDQTEMSYEADARVGGRIASVGQRLIDSSAKAIIKQSLEGLNKVVVARALAAAGGGDATDEDEAAAASDAGAGDAAADDGSTSGEAAQGADTPTPAERPAPLPMPEIEKPTQADFAKAVAKEVAADLIPPKYRIPVIGGIIAAIAGLLWFFFSS